MYSLTYVSSALQLPTPRDLRELLEHCVESNRRCEITGLLLYKSGHFMQVLEGPERAVRTLHGTIAKDPRHRRVVTLLEEEHAGRRFPNWAMGFKDLGADLDKPEGYSEFLNLSLVDSEFRLHPSKAQKLLLLFRAAELSLRD